MRIIPVEQGSDAWAEIRSVRPTASRFHEFITPSKCDYSKQSTKYACEIVAARMKLARVERMPTLWMDWGRENEPNAAHAYEKQFGVKTTKAGFVLPDYSDLFGCSPDRLVNVRKVDESHWKCDRGVEIKCVSPEVLMQMKLNPVNGEFYSKPQVQGSMIICGCPVWDFYAWHPELEPFHVCYEAEESYQSKIAEHLFTFLAEIERVEKTIRKQKHEIIFQSQTAMTSEFQ